MFEYVYGFVHYVCVRECAVVHGYMSIYKCVCVPVCT